MTIPRLTTRRLMALVVCVAVPLGLAAWMQQRVESFQAEASRHLVLWLADAPYPTPEGFGPWPSYHWETARKYERASKRPWLPVETDIPEPR